MQINVNGRALAVVENCNLTQLIDQLSLGDSRVAIELNREIVPRSNYESKILKDGDCIEIVQAIGGG